MPTKELTIPVSGIDFDNIESAAAEAVRQARDQTGHCRFDVKLKHFDIIVHPSSGVTFKDYVFSVSYETEW